MRKRSWAPPSASPSAERNAAACGAGKPVEEAERGAQQLVQHRVGQLGLRLHAARAEHMHVARAGARVLEQDRLADPGLAAQRERPAPRLAGRVEQCADEGALSVPPKQHDPTLPNARGDDLGDLPDATEPA